MEYKTKDGSSVSFTQKERVALHLYRFIETPFDPMNMPDGMTQQGMGAALSISRAHVCDLMTELMKKEFVDVGLAHIMNRPRKVKVYFLTYEGKRYANAQMEKVKEASLDIADLFSERKGHLNPNNTPAVRMVETELREVLEYLDMVRTEKVRRSMKPIALKLMDVARTLISEEWIYEDTNRAWLLGDDRE